MMSEQGEVVEKKRERSLRKRRRYGAIGWPVFKDMYHFLLTTSWPFLIFLLFISFVIMNTFFAQLYMLGGDCIENMREGLFRDAFFFSVQTMTTIGYGTLSPKTDYANFVAAVEAFFGTMSVAMVTGLVFSKFARPTARILFSKRAVVNHLLGPDSLMVRLANERNNRVVEAKVNMNLVIKEKLPNGGAIRKSYELKLSRHLTPVFNRSWTIMHVIDKESPLYGENVEGLSEKEAEIIVTFSGLDETFSQVIHARKSYVPEEIFWNHKFINVIFEQDGQRHMDYKRFHDVEAC